MSFAARFCSRYLRRLVPGIGTMSSPCASTQASASCARRHALALRDRPHARDELQVLLEVLALEARLEAAVVVGGEILEALDLARQEAATERAVRDEPDAELATRREHAVLGIARPQRVLGLQRADRVHGAGAAHRRGRRFGEAEEAHLALLHQLGHRADGVLDRRRRDRRGAGSRDRSSSTPSRRRMPSHDSRT